MSTYIALCKTITQTTAKAAAVLLMSTLVLHACGDNNNPVNGNNTTHSDDAVGLVVRDSGAEIVRSQKPQAEEWRRELADQSIPEAARRGLEKKVSEFEATVGQLGRNRSAVLMKLDDEGFVSGFGSNGGEEFWSYWNLSEALVRDGGNDWLKWDKSMEKNLGRIQNEDGSWSGHHCITGRTFCTSAALLVLLADRTPAAAKAVNAPTAQQPGTAAEPIVPGKTDKPKMVPVVDPAPVIRKAERVGPIKDGNGSR